MARDREDKPQFHSGEQHPERYRHDLNPQGMAGQNVGEDTNPKQSIGARSAYDFKEVHRALHDIPDDELKQIPVLPEGTRLQQGATYFDLRRPEAGTFTALGDMVAGPDNWFIPKDSVAYWLWNRIVGVTDERRLDKGPKGEGFYEERG